MLNIEILHTYITLIFTDIITILKIFSYWCSCPSPAFSAMGYHWYLLSEKKKIVMLLYSWWNVIFYLFISGCKKILPSLYVSIPFRKFTYGPCPCLYYKWFNCTISQNEWEKGIYTYIYFFFTIFRKYIDFKKWNFL